jgi:leucyl/phenylalanyl-tRNA--protein transferase
MIDAYLELHRRGAAHSVETWREGRLVGGLYGVSIAGLFAGESMFSQESDASKIALVHLVERMNARGMSLLDVQVMNPHLERLGAVTIPRAQYLERLKKALASQVSFA